MRHWRRGRRNKAFPETVHLVRLEPALHSRGSVSILWRVARRTAGLREDRHHPRVAAVTACADEPPTSRDVDEDGSVGQSELVKGHHRLVVARLACTMDCEMRLAAGATLLAAVLIWMAERDRERGR